MTRASEKSFARKTTRKIVAAKAARREFVRAIISTAPTEEQERRADELSQRARAATTADFLSAYRVIA